MFYGGESNVPGAPGNLLAGLSFPVQGGSSIGKPLLPNFKELKGDKRDPSFPPEENIPRYLLQQATFPGSSNLPGAVGNMGGLANAQFFDGPQLGQAAPQGAPQQPYGGAPNVPLTPEQKAKLMQQGTPPPPEFNIQDYLRKAQAPGEFQTASLIGRYPRGMEGAVDLTYPPGHPMYGKPILLPGSQTPMDANKAEYEGLRRMRSAPIDPRLTPEGFQNKMVY